MLNGYHLLTLTHRQVPLESIGKAIVREEDARQALQLLKDRFAWEEVMYLATCNRVLYFFYSTAPLPDALAKDVLAAIRPDHDAETLAALAADMRLLHGADAIQHLLEVASSMDSLVVGEREIIRQLREAYERCRDAQLTGDHIRLLMRFTLETAKEVYASTGIGEKALSVVALAFQRLQESGLRPQARILLVGAGQTNALMAKFLFKYGFQNVTVFNRTLAKAQAVAEYLEGLALPLDALGHYTGGFDALIVCTGAAKPLITPELYRHLLAGDTSRKMLIDLAVPNNVDARVPEQFTVTYVDVESLREKARENLEYRETERQKAALILSARVREFRDLWHQRQVERAILPLVDDVKAAKERAFETVFAKDFSALDPAARELVRQMMDYLEKKSVAAAMRTMKEVAQKASRHAGSPTTAPANPVKMTP